MNLYRRSLSPTTHLKQLPKHGGCARKTWYQLHSKVAKNPTDTSGADTGIITHELLERWLKARQRDQEFDFRAALVDLSVTRFRTTKLTEQMMESVLEYAREAERQINKIGPIKLFCDPEATFFFPWISRAGDYHNVKGKIDLIFSCPDPQHPGHERLCIGDFKTGRLEYEAPDGRPQFSTYVWLIEQLYGHHAHVPLPNWVYIFGLRDREIKKIRVDDHYIEHVEDDLNEYLEFIQSQDPDQYPRHESGLCKRHCEYSRDCVGISMGRRAT